MIPKCIENKKEFENIKNKQENQNSKLEIVNEYLATDLNQVCKYGHVVRVDYRGKILKDIPNNTTFLKVPYMPNNDICLIIGLGERYLLTETKWAYITKSGEIKDGALSKNQYIHVHFTYISTD